MQSKFRSFGFYKVFVYRKMVNTAHRAGPLKQQNKGHKTGGHRSKGAVAALNRGRISSASSGGIKKVKKESKVAKKNKMKQLRQLKYEHILELKKGFICCRSIL